MENIITEHLETIISLYGLLPKIEEISDVIIQSYKDGNKVLTMGNGGSSCDAEHMVGELVSKFNFDRDGLPAICLSSHTSALTAIGNDYDYNSVFSRQVKAYGKQGDVVIGFTTSGTSPNIIAGLNMAKELGCIPILITGNKVSNDDFITLNIDSSNTPRIQEGYFLAMHMICERVENELFG
jgi:D-sedoheptulose 7-phosphate isomerase